MCDKMPNNKKKQRNSVLHALSFSSQVGVIMAACIFIGVFLGKFLDNLLGSSPWLVLVCSLLGAAASFWAIFQLAQRK